MAIKLDQIDLAKPATPHDPNNPDLRTILWLSIVDKRNLVEVDIPGSSGNILQDNGAEPVLISLEGEITGKGASDTVEKLISKYEGGKPLSFYSDLTAIADVSKVLIEKLETKEILGSVSKFTYKIDLRESRQ